ncbi:MAG: 4Fe-4S dicluster domain-containing protein [Cloacibacillus sp.]
MKRIFIDADKCDGCMNCSLACMNAHRGDGGSSIYTLEITNVVNESRNFIMQDEHKNYRPVFCRHCAEPMCVVSCMSGAMSKDAKSGLVLYDEKKCGACFMCVMNCPYGVPKPDVATRSKVIKCDFCSDKADGPSCVKACPKEAIHVEEVDE